MELGPLASVELPQVIVLDVVVTRAAKEIKFGVSSEACCERRAWLWFVATLHFD
jgi:hypothetical protein